MNLLALLSLLGLSGNVWAIISRALPVAIRLVKALDDSQGLTGKQKAEKVITGIQEDLAKEGYIITETYDHLLNFVLELALVITRHGKEEKVASIKKTKAKSPPRTITGGRP